MGHNLSIRRPKISLTWVLRDQQNQPSSSQQKKSLDWKQTEKILFRKPKEKLFSEKYVNDNNVKDEHGMKVSVDNLQANLNDVAKSERARKFREKLCGQRRSTESNYDQLEVSKSKSLSQANLSIKNTYSEPSIYITSAQSDSMALGKRYRRRRKRSPKFGYNIKNVDDFLSKCSLSNPANIPVVLSNSSILYQTRSGYHQIEIPLPLGMVVNSVFKNQNWLYVQTPHGEEGYVNFNACLPLGIIPNHKPNSSVNKPKPCWESNIDVFPSPCGNLTDSEKEVQLRGGTRSEGRRTPKLRRSDQSWSEKYLDSLYLKAASQPKTIDHSYAQLKPTNMCTLTNYNNFDKLNGDYVQLKHNRDKINLNTRRQVLLAITENFASDMIQVIEGDIVSLLAYKEYQESGALRQWYFIRNSEGFEGYIPSSITNEFL
ncbi:CLUMA_CG009016, isoform A [Clunio marinus]|uniref:CLUMA_CG009016, isoform A n=1 Tax=Clunio marinus TaxID=568069 RepID=A0A1J1I5D6_9DIPT|nr:CLUMA_CG009016, isoform A [Clunio marinus]